MPTTPTRESALKLLALTAFFILSAISLVIWWVPLTSSFALALRDDQYTHILLILPMSAALIFLDWKSPNPSSGLATSLGSASLGSASLGSVLLVVAASVTFYVRSRVVALPFDERLSLNMLALVVWWIAAFILCFGTGAFRRELFPLCFLFGMAPLPGFVLNLIVTLLQQGSAAVAHFLFVVAGVPVEQAGLLLHIPGLTVEVARECSSIRSVRYCWSQLWCWRSFSCARHGEKLWSSPWQFLCPWPRTGFAFLSSPCSRPASIRVSSPEDFIVRVESSFFSLR